MTTRRDVLMGGVAASTLAGCGGGEKRAAGVNGLPPVPVDIHNHIFNARDIPIAGFAEQVFLRHPETPVAGGPSIARALIGLIVDIVLAARETPTAAQELASLSSRSRLPERPGGDLVAQDRRAVERGLRILEDKVNTAGERREASRLADGPLPAANGDEVLFSTLAAETGVETNPVGLFGNLRRNSDERGGTARQIAAAVYRDDAEETTFKTLAQRDAPDQSLAQNLRWAGLLTRSRVDILGELIRLYAHQPATAPLNDPDRSNGIKVFSPSLVDFTYWLDAADDRDRDRSGQEILDQITLLSKIAYLERGALLLPFAPFCPLRAAVYRKAGRGDWLERIKAAVASHGFAGVKLYPPMGFLPLENADLDPAKLPRALRRHQISGQDIDDELRALYAWCAQEDVPIKAHGNNSLGADACTGQNAAAENWRPVLETPGWANLRLNIAHFGGFDETRFEPQKGCPIPDQSYEAQAVDLIATYDNLYVDLGYWTDVTGTNRTNPVQGQPTPANRTVRQFMTDELARNDKLKSRLMYGSDWSMIGREEQHAEYFSDVDAALRALLPDEAERLAILSTNALRYLGLDRRGKQFDRLAAFFDRAPQFNAVMKLVRPSSSIAAIARDLFSSR